VAFPVIFNKVCAGRTFFQSVLVELQLNEGTELDGLYKTVMEKKKKLLEPGDDTLSTPYYPHVSLYYGEKSAEGRETMVRELVQRGAVKMADGDANVTVAGVEGGFRVTEIWIVDCNGPVESWKALKKISLFG